MDRFAEALARVVRPGDAVLDIGAGTGLLAMLACRAGARHAYAIEAGPAALLAQAAVDANGLADRVTVIRGWSTETTLPERANVLVTETLWNFGVGEGLVGWVADARERLLTPDAAIIPQAFDIVVAPIEAARVAKRIEVPCLQRHGIDVDVLGQYLPEHPQIEALLPNHLLGPPAVLASVDLRQPVDALLEGHVELTVERSGTLNGVGGWFDAQLARGVQLANEPGRESSWSNTVLPLGTAVAVKAGDTVDVRFQSASNGAVFRWRLSVHRHGELIAAEDRASPFGFPVDRHVLERTHSTAPRRGRRGACIAAALDLLDGTRTRDAVLDALMGPFADVLPTRAAAEAVLRDALAVD